MEVTVLKDRIRHNRERLRIETDSDKKKILQKKIQIDTIRIELEGIKTSVSD